MALKKYREAEIIEDELISFTLSCDRCHRFLLDRCNQRFWDSQKDMLAVAEKNGWKQVIDGTLQRIKVWLCRGCATEVAILRGDDHG